MSERLRCIAARVVRLLEGGSKDEQFIVHCTECRRNVPIGMKEFPFHSVSVVCNLCGANRQYRPSEIRFGVPDKLACLRVAEQRISTRPDRRSELIGLFR